MTKTRSKQPREKGYFEQWREVDLMFERLEGRFSQEEISAGLHRWLLLRLGSYGEVPDFEEWMVTVFCQMSGAAPDPVSAVLSSGKKAAL